MSAALDAILTCAIVMAAASYVVWRVILPVRVKVMLGARMTGKPVPCAPEPSGGCAGGCSGCMLAKPAPQTDLPPNLSKN